MGQAEEQKSINDDPNVSSSSCPEELKDSLQNT